MDEATEFPRWQHWYSVDKLCREMNFQMVLESISSQLK